jgi:hypothetical protein
MDSQRVAQQVWAAVGGRIQERVTRSVRRQLEGQTKQRLWPLAWDRLDPITDTVLLQAKEDYRG